MSQEPNFEKSTQQAAIIKPIMNLVSQLDVEYLTMAHKKMKEAHSFRDSVMILNPNPLTHMEKQELAAAETKQLELMLKLAKNYQVIKDKTIELHEANNNVQKLNKMFGNF
jgi:hypothetical protein